MAGELSPADIGLGNAANAFRAVHNIAPEKLNRKGAEPEAKKRPVWFPVAFLHKSGGSKRAGTPAFHKSGKFIELFCNLVLTFGCFGVKLIYRSSSAKN